MKITKITATHDNIKEYLGNYCFCDCCRKPIAVGDQFYTDDHVYHCENCGLFEWETYPEDYYELYRKCADPDCSYPLTAEGLDDFYSDVSATLDILYEMHSNLEENREELEEKFGNRFTDFYEELEENIEHANYSLEIIETADIDEDYANTNEVKDLLIDVFGTATFDF